MPGKSNHGKNNTFKLRAEFSFPVLTADAPSGMLGELLLLLEQDAEHSRADFGQRLVVNF